MLAINRVCLLAVSDSVIFLPVGANVFYHMEKYEEAIADCERATTLDPNFTKVS